MNIVILTGRFGMGHVKCAEAIKESLEMKKDVTVHTVDFMDWIFPKSSKAIYGGFSLLVSKVPRIYNYLNVASGKYGKVPLKKALVRKIDKLIDEYDLDMIISDIPISGKYVSAYKDIRKCKIPLYTYITDITVHEEWIADNVEKYFVGDVSTKIALIEKGVPSNKIHITGIPVKSEFHKSFEKGIKPALVKTEADKKQVLIMGGGLGMIPSDDNLLQALNNMKNVNAVLIAGKNIKLVEMAKAKFPNIEVIGYTDRVADFMKASDVIVTKPGGITTFEAIASKTPLYVVEPFLEQEKGNAEFIRIKGLGRVVDKDNKNKGADLQAFLNNQDLLLEMKGNMQRVTDSFEAVDPVCDFEMGENRIWA